jgi:hypothetical protein
MSSTVELALPSPWTSHQDGEQTIWTLPGTQLRVEVDALIPTPEDRKTWGERVLLRHLPPGGKLEQLDIVDSIGRTGYFCTIVSTKISSADGDPREFRLSCFYEFLHHGGAIVCRVTKPDVARWESQERAVVIEAIRAARPSIQSGEVGYLGDLYDLTPMSNIPRRRPSA